MVEELRLMLESKLLGREVIEALRFMSASKCWMGLEGEVGWPRVVLV